ncbi:MAG: hypothetical protein DMG14_26015 [Acidobacteria bacterium]|nr:MAG: hypothetical protein DMG14_26015 [Acidobacteriota bacterium]PYS49226.1 MAG: hypothetical protein DMG13_23845 [Acidobacteriota bacterium]
MKNVSVVSFARNIRPLFRDEYINYVKPMNILLDQYTYMSNAANNHQNAKRVYDSLTGKTKPRMPIDRPYWTKDELDLFKNWMNGGYKP